MPVIKYTFIMIYFAELFNEHELCYRSATKLPGIGQPKRFFLKIIQKTF